MKKDKYGDAILVDWYTKSHTTLFSIKKRQKKNWLKRGGGLRQWFVSGSNYRTPLEVSGLIFDFKVYQWCLFGFQFGLAKKGAFVGKVPTETRIRRRLREREELKAKGI